MAGELASLVIDCGSDRYLARVIEDDDDDVNASALALARAINNFGECSQIVLDNLRPADLKTKIATPVVIKSLCSLIESKPYHGEELNLQVRF
jgi:hypothetical protein